MFRHFSNHRAVFAAFVSIAFSLLSVFVLPSFAAEATGSLGGQVLDSEGRPIAGAEVTLVELRQRANTDTEGRFTFQDLAANTYLVTAEASQGEVGVRVRIRAGEVSQVELRLVRQHHDDEIVVIGGLVRSQLELAQATTVLHGEELDLRLQPSLGETLAQQPGITSTFFGAGASRPVIRGLGGDRVRMLSGGLDAGDVSSTSPDHAVSAEPALAERIEVLRGPSTLLYGSSAIGGVVNVVDGAIAEHPAEKSLSGKVELGASSVDGGQSAALGLTGGGGPWVWTLGGLWRKTDDYDIPGAAEVEHEGEEHEGEEHEEEIVGTLPNSDIESRSATVGLTRLIGDQAFVGLSVSTFDSEYGIPAGHEHAEEEGEEHGEEEHAEEEGHGVRIDMKRRRVDLRAESTQEFGPFKGFRGRVGWVDYEHSELEGEEREVGTTFFNDSLEGRFELVQKERGSHSGSVGLQFGARSLEAVGEEAFIPPVDNQLLSIFTLQELERLDGRLRLQMGGRYERQENEVDAALPDRSFDGLSVSVGAVYQLGGDYALAGSLARSVKLPNGEELYALGPHAATATYEIGNIDLEEETSLGAELALRKTKGRLTFELSVYRNDFSDFIYQAFTGEEEDGLAVVVNTQEDAEFTGAEFQGRGVLFDDGESHLDLTFQGDIVRAELADGGYLPRIPPRRAGLGLHYHRAGFSLFAEVWSVADQNRLAENETPTEGYELVNAGGSYQWLVGGNALELVVRARNLGDEEARNHVSYLKDAVPYPGRDLGLTLRWSF